MSILGRIFPLNLLRLTLGTDLLNAELKVVWLIHLLLDDNFIAINALHGEKNRQIFKGSCSSYVFNLCTLSNLRLQWNFHT
jgi:hypothetical protein